MYALVSSIYVAQDKSFQASHSKEKEVIEKRLFFNTLYMKVRSA